VTSIDKLREALRQILISIAQTLHRSGPEVFQQNVRARQKPVEDGPVRRCLQVQRDRLLAAVERREIGAVLAHEGREGPRVVAGCGPFDLDDMRPEIAERHGRERPGEHMRQVEDDDSGEGV
jgi:hypothetical protein